MARGLRARGERFRSEALLVRSVPLGEGDVVATFFTRSRGVVAAVARGARRSSKRFPALEPFHILDVSIDERPGSDLGVLVEASIARTRLRLAARLTALEAAGRALRWVRRALPPGTPEPSVWHEANALLDALDAQDPPSPEACLAGMGLRMLAALGYGLDLERCVRCGKTAAPTASAYVDPERGGLVCRSCGGGPMLLASERRRRLAPAASGGDGALEPGDVRVALALVDAAFAAHVGAGSTR